jgi:hypothetical protein
MKNFFLITGAAAGIFLFFAACRNPSGSDFKPETEGRFKSVGASTAGATYYVDAATGDDTKAGTSPGEAWKSLDKVTSTTFQSGDHILLRADGVWNDQMLYPKGNGSSGKPIVVDFYSLNSAGDAVYRANTRPIINANGSPPIGTDPYIISGAVMIYDQEYWEFYNLEVTNSYNLSDPAAYKKSAPRQLAGILAYAVDQTSPRQHLVIKNCYVHDVQTEYYQDFAKASDHAGGSVGQGGLKAAGGIIVLGHWLDPDGNILSGSDSSRRSKAAYNDVLIEGNVVKRVGLEGIRTKCNAGNGDSYNKQFTNVVIRGNYLEEIAGDGIVLSEVANGGLVENNVIKQACNADLGRANYASLWCWFSDNALIQYNEVYGNIYGYNDSEAYDIDLQCDSTIYQYNYSHNNSGGFMLVMAGPTNSIIRYNVSANDGGGNRGVGADRNAPTSDMVYDYVRQSIFHYWETSTTPGRISTVYNNTFFVGDGISTALIGEGNTNVRSNVRMRFYNNILYKEGEGTLRLWEDYPADGSAPVERKLADLTVNFRNNIIYPADKIITQDTMTLNSAPATAQDAIEEIVKALKDSGNIFTDPKLMIASLPEYRTSLAEQNNTVYNMKDDLAAFTGIAKLRERTGLFKVQKGSPAISAGTKIQSLYADVPGGIPGVDIFGNPLAQDNITIGAHQY